VTALASNTMTALSQNKYRGMTLLLASGFRPCPHSGVRQRWCATTLAGQSAS